MELLEERIKNDGDVLPGNILKVNNFLNHQLDIELLDVMGKEFAKIYNDCEVTKVLTIEASGIAVAYPVAQQFKVPLVFAKKHQSLNMNGELYASKVWSFTHQKNYDVVVTKKFLNKNDKVLIVDDFLANGSALNGLIDIVEQSGAKVQGICIAIEKGFQDGGNNLRKKGYRIESLAIIEKMTDDGQIFFRH